MAFYGLPVGIPEVLVLPLVGVRVRELEWVRNDLLDVVVMVVERKHHIDDAFQDESVLEVLEVEDENVE